ncbi:MAG TPA: LPS-assembly protein LptD [Acidiferrobacteraceae bacterium]|nr:LPS-assembly protein LptD [Acidiferrobacteraceae bacterium]
MQFHKIKKLDITIKGLLYSRHGAIVLALCGGSVFQPTLAAEICAPDLLPMRVLPPDQADLPMSKLPIELEADQIEKTKQGPVIFTGRAVANQGLQSISADKLTYTESKDEVEAEGNVELRTADGDAISTSFIRYKLEAGVGETQRADYHIADRSRNTGDPKTVAMLARGSAEKIELAGFELFKLSNATYTTCVKGQDDVILSAGKVDLDFATGEGHAKNMTVRFKGVPIFYAPSMSFPISDKRKSGFLFPVFGSVADSGFVFGVPYYWNIAPNMDATITPLIMANRGLKMDGEFRYLQEDYSGIVSGSYLPNDSEFGADRGAFNLKHKQQISSRWSGDVDYQWVSDEQYFDDFVNRIGFYAQTHLPQQAKLDYKGKLWDFSASVLQYQTVDDSISAANRPHKRLPRLTLKTKIPRKRGGPKFDFYGEMVNFSHDTRVSGTRLDLTPSVSYPMDTVYGFLKPKVAVRHTSYYGLENIAAGSSSNPSRTVGVLSVEGGLFFERDTSYRGDAMVQTLEPRIFYVYANRNDQGDLPVFDTSAVAFNNFSDFFRDNQFVGADRVEDANRVTLALTSRLLDGAKGRELMQVSVGQIFYLDDREVTFNGTPQTRSTSDILLDASANLTPTLRTAGFLQWNPSDNQTEQAKFTVNYSPRTDAKVYASYRYTRRSRTDQADLGFNWPLASRWDLRGRYIYSLTNKQSLLASASVGYNACCWSAHVLVQRRVDTTTDYRNAVIFQLRLTGLAKISTGF